MKNLGILLHVPRKTADRPPGKSVTGDRVYYARKALEAKRKEPISQEKLAEAGGLDRVQVLTIEAGRNKASGSKAREGLAKAFGVSMEHLTAYLAGAYGKPGAAAARHFVEGLPPPGGTSPGTPKLSDLADFFRLPLDIVIAFQASPGETKSKMRFDELPEPARRAAWAVVHAEECTIEAAFRTAYAVFVDEEFPDALQTDDWFRRIQTRVKNARPGSGTRPSERSLKISS